MDIRRLDLNLLLLLDRLYAVRSLTAAAQALGIRQPLASNRLARLRLFFRDQMFVRTGRGMRPTPFTESIMPPLREALATIEAKVLRKPGHDAAASEREFTVTTSDIGILVFLPPLLEALARVAPGVSIRCVTLPHQQLNEAFESGAIDLAIGYFPDLGGPNIGSGHLFDHPFVCIVRHGHHQIGATLSVEQFLATDHLVVDQDGRSQEIVERRIVELRLQRRVRLHIPSFLAVPQIVAHSEMLSVVPASLAAAFAPIFPLRILPPPFSIPPIALRYFWHRRAEDDPEIGWLRRLVQTELGASDPTATMTRR